MSNEGRRLTKWQLLAVGAGATAALIAAGAAAYLLYKNRSNTAAKKPRSRGKDRLPLGPKPDQGKAEKSVPPAEPALAKENGKPSPKPKVLAKKTNTHQVCLFFKPHPSSFRRRWRRRWRLSRRVMVTSSSRSMRRLSSATRRPSASALPRAKMRSLSFTRTSLLSMTRW